MFRTSRTNAQAFLAALLRAFTTQLLPRGGPGRYPGYQPSDFNLDLCADFLDSPLTQIR